jgi:prolyl oligopeptidase
MRALVISMLFLVQAAQVPAPGPIPNTPKKPVTDTYQGSVKVVDDYRWLENLDDPQVKAWSDAQNTRAREYLARLPSHAAIGSRLKELVAGTPGSYYALRWCGGRLFALEAKPPKNQPFIVTIGNVDDRSTEKVVVDPNVINPKGTTAVDFFVPSLDGKYTAVSLSDNGSEEGSVHVYETATGKEVFEVVPRVNGGTAGGSLAWNADSTGFWYSRYPRGTERPKQDMSFFTQVYFHKLGTKTETDTYEIGRDFPRIAEIALSTSNDGTFVVARVANGDGGEFAFYLRGVDGKWSQFANYADEIVRSRFGVDGKLYLLSRKDAPHGRILSLPLATPTLGKATVVVKHDSEFTIEAFEPTKTRLYVTDVVGGPSDLRVFDLAGNPQGTIPLVPVSAVSELVRTDGDAVLFDNESFLDPPAWFRIANAGAKPAKTALVSPTRVDFSDAEVRREVVISKDGTEVPVNLIMKKGTKLDHANPTILYGYGGYGVNVAPSYSTTRRFWLDQGVIFAVANLRGGGEFGEQWHRAGNLLNKQNVFDDFIASAQHLIAHGYTSRDKLALMGGSNGGLLMGAVTTQRPELATAVVSYVGVYDMLRVETQPNGAFNVTEYGTVKDPAQFKTLSAYSPYHHVKDGTTYPAMLLTTGVHDPRVEPSNSYKMVARLQSATSSKAPILLRVAQSGHGIGSSLDDKVDEATDVSAFILQELGVNYRPSKTQSSTASRG